MFLYKFNWFTKKYYKYDTDEIDIFSPMFDEQIHNNDATPIRLDRKVCMYCNTCFVSRNKLFHHLSYMNINTRPLSDSNSMNMNDEGYQSDKGEYGYEMSSLTKKLNKIKKLNKKRRYW